MSELTPSGAADIVRCFEALADGRKVEWAEALLSKGTDQVLVERRNDACEWLVEQQVLPQYDKTMLLVLFAHGVMFAHERLLAAEAFLEHL